MNSNISIKKHKLNRIAGDRLRLLHDAPKQLYFKGVDPSELLTRPAVAIVGSRKMTPYGRAVTEQLAADLAKAGVVIVSGLALGVDSAAHRMAVVHKTPTIAVLAGGLEKVHPPSHFGLAEDILRGGGALVSEYEPAMPSLPHQFVARNRIIAALADAVLVTEAAAGSGSLHTANFALDLGKPVLAVPGPITSTQSSGCNQLLKTGALLVTNVQDILEALQLPTHHTQLSFAGSSAEETAILEVLAHGNSAGQDLLAACGLEAAAFSHTLTMLEINGRIKALGSDTWALA